MKSLSQIAALYGEIDGCFEDQRLRAIADGDQAARQRIEEKQLLNDHAYFILCWGQLETEVDDASRAAIRRRQSSANWEMRRGFDFYDPDDRRLSGLPFERRAALVLDRAGDPSGSFAKLMSYYETRNRIAHGRVEAKRIDVLAVVADFYVIQSAIKR
jgi:hypothetical protein